MPIRAVNESGGSEIEQPRGNDAAPPPHFADLRNIELVLIVIGPPKRGRFSVDPGVGKPDAGMLEDVQAFGIRGHDAVFDPVVDHLDEMTGATRPAMQIAVFGRKRLTIPARCPVGCPDSRCECSKDRVEVMNRIGVATDHEAEPTFETEHTAAGTHVEQPNASF